MEQIGVINSKSIVLLHSAPLRSLGLQRLHFLVSLCLCFTTKNLDAEIDLELRTQRKWVIYILACGVSWLTRYICGHLLKWVIFSFIGWVGLEERGWKKKTVGYSGCFLSFMLCPSFSGKNIDMYERVRVWGNNVVIRGRFHL